jgi:hypothetical protein
MRGVNAMGWDVTAEGKALVYQETIASPGPLALPGHFTDLKTHSQFMAVAFANPTSPTPILGGAESNFNAYVTISPNQQSVAVVATDTLPDTASGNSSNALVYTGSLSGGAASSHSPAAGGPPAWTADSTSFDTGGWGKEFAGAPTPYLLHWQTNTANPVGQLDGAHHPASLP